jgi:hypothetical protein
MSSDVAPLSVSRIVIWVGLSFLQVFRHQKEVDPKIAARTAIPAKSAGRK